MSNEHEVMDHRTKRWLLYVSAATVVILAISALRENIFPAWRSYRSDYQDILEKIASDDLGRDIAARFEVRLAQYDLPHINRADRCITCHTGVDDPRMTDQPQPFTSHPGQYLTVHDPASFGCTVCHEGQGLATEVEAAHGYTPHWEEPLLAREHIKTTCARCHTEVDLYGSPRYLDRLDDPDARGIGTDLLARGRELVTKRGCLGCHMIGGRGGTLGPDITAVGDKSRHNFDFSHVPKNEPREVANWLKLHFLDPAGIIPTTSMPNIGFSEREADALTTYMLSLREPVPALTAKQFATDIQPPEGSALYARFCSACHGDRGGATEPLADIQTPSIANVDALAIASDNYYRLIIASGRAGTNMPSWGGEDNLTRDEIDRIVLYMRSWQRTGADIASVDAAYGDPAHGRAYYQGLCANCHGRKGEGGIGNALNTLTFMSVAWDQFLARTIMHGRPGTAMAAWTHLPSQAVSDLLAYMKTWQRTAPSWQSVSRSMQSHSQGSLRRIGRRLYLAHCATCHGRDGEGGIGVSLNSPDLLRVVDNRFLHTTITEGRPSTAMPAWRHLSAEDVAAIITYVRSWQNGSPLSLRSVPAGDFRLGEFFYKDACQRCHGIEGTGGIGPQLVNPVLLSSASDATLYHWIGHGRGGSAMIGFLPEAQGPVNLTHQQIADVIAYLRQLGKRGVIPVLRDGPGDAVLGRELFVSNCGSCHGYTGEGGSGPQLNNASFLEAASDGFITATMVLGRTGTAMRSMVHGQEGLGQIMPHQVADVVAYIRTWQEGAAWRRPRPFVEMSWPAITEGRELFAHHCAGCHGPNGKASGEGTEYFAPQLHNQDFLNAASDGFLLATIARGRSNTPMRPFGEGAGGIASLKPQQIMNIVSFIRTWQAPPVAQLGAER